MTYRELRLFLDGLTDDQLNQDATIYYESWDEFYLIDDISETINTDVLEDHHVIFIVK
jgi:hypothetical protein